MRNQHPHDTLKEYCEVAVSVIKSNIESKDDLPLTPVPEFEFTDSGYSFNESMKINWAQLEMMYERVLKELPTYQKAVQALEADGLIAKQLNTLVGTNMALRRIDADYCLSSLLITYLNEQEKTQEDVFSQIYERIENFFYQDIIPFRYIAPLNNFKMEAERVELKQGFSIIKLSVEERVSILSRVYGIDALSSQVSYQGLESCEYALECLQEEPKVIGQRSNIDPNKFVYNIVIQNFEAAVTALRLYKPGSVSYAHVIEKSDAWNPVGGQMHSPQFLYPPFLVGIIYELTNDEIPRFVEFWRQFEQAQISEKALKTALSRFSFVYERGRLEDRLIDYIISLEALLLENEQELRYKFSLRGSALLGGDDPQKRVTIFYELYEGYGQRNNIAHGNIPKQTLTVGGETLQFAQLVERIGNHARSTIRAFILLRKSKKQIVEMLNNNIIEGFILGTGDREQSNN